MQKKTILVIEDNEQNIYLITFLLQANGFVVQQARDGIEGLKLAESTEPDLILLDIQLPGLNGHEVAKQLKKNPQTKAVPVVAVTSHAMAGDRETIMAAGCEGYIEKPIDPDNFVKQISPFFME